jgi:hypothetical protein
MLTARGARGVPLAFGSSVAAVLAALTTVIAAVITEKIQHAVSHLNTSSPSNPTGPNLFDGPVVAAPVR